MSDYNSLRLKRNAELQNAIASVRNDLYEWKSSTPKSNVSRPGHPKAAYTPPLRLKSLDSSMTTSESAENLGPARNNSRNGDRFSSNSALNLTRKLERKEQQRPPVAPPAEFLRSFNTNLNLAEITEDKAYLNSARKGNVALTGRRNQKEMQEEFVSFFHSVRIV